MVLTQISWPFIFQKSYIRTLKGGNTFISDNVKIKNSNIYVYPGAELIIERDVIIENVTISLHNGKFKISKGSLLKGYKYKKLRIEITEGEFSIGHHSKLTCDRVWVRFGGNLVIGDYTNINEGSEIRCDENVSIGSFCQISYNVRIWDTNTHEKLPPNERRKRTEDYFPIFGYELSRPATKPTSIGNDCWIGEFSAILKGSKIGNNCIVGFHTTLIGEIIPDGKTVVNTQQLKLF